MSFLPSACLADSPSEATRPLQDRGARRADLVPAARKVPVSALRLDVCGIRYHGWNTSANVWSLVTLCVLQIIQLVDMRTEATLSSLLRLLLTAQTTGICHSLPCPWPYRTLKPQAFCALLRGTARTPAADAL